MKRTILLCIALFWLLPQSFSQSKCDCWEEEFASKNQDFKRIFSILEASFIAHGYLKNDKPKSYLELADYFISENRYDIKNVQINPVFSNKFEECFFLNSCDQDSYNKIMALSVKFMSYRNINPKICFIDIKKTFNRKDFKKTEVKLYFLTFFHITFLQDPPTLPNLKMLKDTIDAADSINQRNILTIEISARDSIFANEKTIRLEDLKKTVFNFITDKSDSINSPETEKTDIPGLGIRTVLNTVIVFLSQNSASYNMYMEVQNEINLAFTAARNQIAVEEYGISYEEMLKKKDSYSIELKTVRTLLPKNITEREP